MKNCAVARNFYTGFTPDHTRSHGITLDHPELPWITRLGTGMPSTHHRLALSTAFCYTSHGSER